jgi:hypothetical protein
MPAWGSTRVSREAALEEITDVLLMSDSDYVNALAGVELRQELGHNHAYRLPDSEELLDLVPGHPPGAAPSSLKGSPSPSAPADSTQVFGHPRRVTVGRRCSSSTATGSLSSRPWTVSNPRGGKVDPPEISNRGGDEVLEVFLPTDVSCDRKRPDRRGTTATALLVEVRQQDVGTLLREPCAQRETDAARAARHHGHLAVDVHRWSSRRCLCLPKGKVGAPPSALRP